MTLKKRKLMIEGYFEMYEDSRRICKEWESVDLDW